MPATGAIEYLRDHRPERFVGAQQSSGSCRRSSRTSRWTSTSTTRAATTFRPSSRYSKLWKEAVFDREGSSSRTSRRPSPSGRWASSACSAAANLMTAPDRSWTRVAAPGLRRARRERLRQRARAAARFARCGAAVGRRRGRRFDAVLEPGFDPRREAIVERPIAGLAEQPLRPGAAGGARIVEDEPERVVIEADANRRALLVLADVHYPGWKAELDGEEVPIERVDYLLRGVALPRRRAPGRVPLRAAELADRLDHEPHGAPRAAGRRRAQYGQSPERRRSTSASLTSMLRANHGSCASWRTALPGPASARRYSASEAVRPT